MSAARSPSTTERALVRKLAEARSTSRSQLAVRLLGMLCACAVPLVAPSGHQLSPVAVTLVVLGALLAAARPEPAGGPVALAALGAYLLVATQDPGSPRVLVVAALVVVHLACVAVSTTAPGSARLDPRLLRRYVERCTALTALGVVAWGAGMVARASLPAAPVPVVIAALLGVAAVGWAATTERPR
ncbi:hypothetical protein ACF3NS_14615 [Arsenicicoccus cauae]|uniref:hypothetical protein n=1 Tax=Arsenicicoccus cauae TaxID=2663847 RepID=UPI00370DB7AB